MLRPDRGRANTEFARKSTSRQPQPANPMSPIRPINSPNQHLGNSSRTTEKRRKNRLACTPFDTERLVHHIEAAYVHMRDRAERGLAPERFSVSALSPPPSITRETC